MRQKSFFLKNISKLYYFVGDIKGALFVQNVPIEFNTLYMYIHVSYQFSLSWMLDGMQTAASSKLIVET